MRNCLEVIPTRLIQVLTKGVKYGCLTYKKVSFGVCWLTHWLRDNCPLLKDGSSQLEAEGWWK